MKVPMTLVTVKSGSPAKKFGQLGKVPLSTTKRGLLRAAIPTDIPDTAVVTKAEAVLTTRAAAWAGTRDLETQPIDEEWAASKVTWNTQPDVAGTIVTETVGATAEDTEIRIDLGTDVQAIVSGTLRNWGWRLTTDDATTRYLWGAVADQYQPWLDLEWVELLEAPVNLSPNGRATAVSHPVLTFDTPEPESIQVQIDPAADDVSPDWDSGEVAATGGMLALADTDYTGLADAATTYWRARSKNVLGWSEWSEWAELPRIAHAAASVTSPGVTTADTTPPITWTYAATQTAWRVWVYNAVTGEEVADSSKQTGTDTEWTPDGRVLKSLGATARVVVRLWDDEDRAATAATGDTAYTQAELTTELVASHDAAGVDSIEAYLVGEGPTVRVTWDNTPMADRWVVTRDGEWLEVLEGAEAEYYDYSASPLREHVYQVLHKTIGGDVSPNGPSASVTVNLAYGGIWLINPDNGASVTIFGREAGEFRMDEQAVVHDVLGSTPVRRRMGLLPPAGRVVGGLYTVGDRLAEDHRDRLLRWKKWDAGTVFRLVRGDQNLPVTIGNIVVDSTPTSDTDDLHYAVSFDWWQTDTDLPWDN